MFATKICREVIEEKRRQMLSVSFFIKFYPVAAAGSQDLKL
jgi:hypothetical protein